MIIPLRKGLVEGKDHFRFFALECCRKERKAIHWDIRNLGMLKRVNAPVTGTEKHHATRRAQ